MSRDAETLGPKVSDFNIGPQTGGKVNSFAARNMIKHQNEECRWDGVDVYPYKEDGTHFKSITRQTLFKGDEEMPVEFRYFEIQADGHSTLERHDHQHLVMIIRGSGHVLVGDQVTEVGMHDVVHVPAQTWHQFRATGGEILGFVCVVQTARDKPQRPNQELVQTFKEQAREFARV